MSSGSHEDKTDEKHMGFFEQACVLIASWPLHFAPCLLKAVVTLRESKKAALVFAGLVGGPKGSQLVPKPEGSVLRSCSIPGKLGFAALSGLGGSCSSLAVQLQLLRGKLLSQECVRMPASVCAHSLSSLKCSPARPQGRKQNVLGRAQEVLENSSCCWR